MCTGFSDVIGSWKIIEMSFPRTCRRSFGFIVTRSSPFHSASPLVIVLRFGLRPMIVRQVTLLPEPDSPTMPERLALLDGERDALDSLDDAVFGAEGRAEVLDVEEGHGRV